MSKPVPSAKELENLAFKCAVGLAILLACAIVDGFDGVVATKGSIYRRWEEPDLFWGSLLVRWGFPAILATLGLLALGVGALVARGVEKASREE